MPASRPKISRVLVVLPSWVGDAVMATPALRAVRRALPGAFIGGLLRSSLAGLLDGTTLLDELHLERAAGMMGPKRVAARVRGVRYDAAILFTNSFSTALVTRLAGIPRRFGYERDARGLLLTDRLEAPKRRDTAPYSRSRERLSEWAPIPACDYYFALARRFLETLGLDAGPAGPLELCVTDEERATSDTILRRIMSPSGTPSAGTSKSIAMPSSASRIAFLNPGGNNPAKRWPADRFASLAHWLVRERGMRVLVSGAPAEADLTAQIVSRVPGEARQSVIDLPAHLAGHSVSLPPLALLKAIIARSSIMVTNDTGPRHIAAALGVPVVSLFGPTDHRWTIIPFDRERRVIADPSLPAEMVANDHPERCAIDRIELDRVVAAANELL